MASHSPGYRITTAHILVLGACALYAFWSLFRIVSTSAPDFSVLYASARHLIQGSSLYNDPSLYTGLGYPQVSLVPYIPFALLPYTLAQIIWVIGSFAAFCGSVYLSIRLARMSTWGLWSTVAIFAFGAFPTRFTFGMGQANYIALFFLLLGISDTSRAQPIRIIALVLALLFKPHFLIVYGALWFSRRRREVVFAGFTTMLIVILLGWLTSWSNDRSYVQTVLPTLLQFTGREIYYNQGVSGMVSRFLGDDGATVALVVSVGIVLATLYKIIQGKLYQPGNILAVMLPVQILVEPLAWQHHHIFLLPVFVLLWFRKIKFGRTPFKCALILAYVLISWNIKNPVYWQGSALAPMILSHASVGLLLVWVMTLVWL